MANNICTSHNATGYNWMNHNSLYYRTHMLLVLCYKRNTPYSTYEITCQYVFGTELCADELVVGGGVGWSYDRRRDAHFSSAAAAWLYGRRRRRQTGWESTETANSLDRRFFLVLQGSATSPVISDGPRRKVNCEYACCAQFYSLSELIVHCLIYGGSHKCNVECWGDADSAGVENAGLENTRSRALNG